MIEAALVL